MHHKNIKAIIKKQLKKNYRDWKRLTKREKKQIAKKVLDEVVADYDFSNEVETDRLELLGIDQQELTSGMMDFDEMARFIDSNKKNVLFKLNKIKRHPLYLKDKELRFIGRHNHQQTACIRRLYSQYEGIFSQQFFASRTT